MRVIMHDVKVESVWGESFPCCDEAVFHVDSTYEAQGGAVNVVCVRHDVEFSIAPTDGLRLRILPDVAHNVEGFHVLNWYGLLDQVSTQVRRFVLQRESDMASEGLRKSLKSMAAVCLMWLESLDGRPQ